MRPPVRAASQSVVTLLRGPPRASRSFESGWHRGGAVEEQNHWGDASTALTSGPHALGEERKVKDSV